MLNVFLMDLIFQTFPVEGEPLFDWAVFHTPQTPKMFIGAKKKINMPGLKKLTFGWPLANKGWIPEAW